MKKIIICSILMLFCLNSCYFIEQAILDEKITATQNRGVKKKDSIFDTRPWGEWKEEKKNNNTFEEKNPFKEVSKNSLKKIEYKGESLNIPDGTQFDEGGELRTETREPLHIYIRKGKVSCNKINKKSKIYYRKADGENYLVLRYSESAGYKEDRAWVVDKIVSANGFLKSCY